MTLTLSQVQQQLGSRYVIKRELGGGSMATVYLAEDTRHRRSVALKLLRPEYGATIAAERFLREIEIAARLQHPHIVPLLDSGEVGGQLFLVLPYVEGESLRVRLVREGRLPAAEVIRILGDVADALAYAHGKGIVHRDIKPDNILLAGRHALVTDFGVAKAVSSATLAPRELTVGVALGTPAYMAPEQATAAPEQDQRVDLYALGVVAYELLTGRPPFERAGAQAILMAQVLEPPIPLRERCPEASPALAAIVDRCLAKRAEDRWQSAGELLRQLEPLATPSGGNTPAAVMRWSRGARAWGLAGGSALAVMLALAAGLLRRAPGMPGGTRDVQRQVTFNGRVKSAAISPDGELLAFVTDSAGRNRLMVQDIRGGQAIELSEAVQLEYPSWSGDGSEIRCTVLDLPGRPVLRRVPRLGGAPRDLAIIPWSSLSPAGDRLATLSIGSGRFTIRDLASGDALNIRTEQGWWPGLPSWSPDGEQLVWAAGNQTGRINRIYISSTRHLSPAVLLEDTLSIGTPEWAPDGGALYFPRARGRVVDLVRLALRAGRASGRPEVLRAALTVDRPETFVATHPTASLSRDGFRLVYLQRQHWSNLALADLARGRPAPLRMLTTGSASYLFARLSPDLKWLAVERAESEDLSLQLLPLDGGLSRELARMSGVSSLAWSRDGRRLVASEPIKGGDHGLVIHSLEGAPDWDFAAGRVGDTPDWLNDTSIVVSRVGNKSLEVVRVGSGDTVSFPGLDTAGWMAFPVVSPDARRVAFGWNQAGVHGVYTLTLGQPGSARLAHGALVPIRWSADGTRLFVLDGAFSPDSDRVYALHGQTGQRTLLGTFPPDAEVVDVYPDGRRAVVNLQQERSDAWLVEFPARR